MTAARETMAGRIGLVIYWCGCAVAVSALFATVLTARSGGTLYIASGLGFAVVSWIVGRAGLFILGGA